MSNGIGRIGGIRPTGRLMGGELSEQFHGFIPASHQRMTVPTDFPQTLASPQEKA